MVDDREKKAGSTVGKKTKWTVDKMRTGQVLGRKQRDRISKASLQVRRRKTRSLPEKPIAVEGNNSPRDVVMRWVARVPRKLRIQG